MMHCGKAEFALVQAAYHSSYLHAEIEMLNFLQHSSFINIRAGAVKSKIEFLKLVQLKKSRGSWYADNSSIHYTNYSNEEWGPLVSSKGQFVIRDHAEQFIFLVHQLWIFIPESSWKILNFILLPTSKGS